MSVKLLDLTGQEILPGHAKSSQFSGKIYSKCIGSSWSSQL